MGKSGWHNTFLGVRQQHCYKLYEVIDKVLIDAPQILRFVEFGTGHGALSVILALHAYQRQGSFNTFDSANRVSLHRVLPVLSRLEAKVHSMDCFSDAALAILKEDTRAPAFFFCDAGNRVEEFKLADSLCTAGSIIAVHDYKPRSRVAIHEVAEQRAYQPFMEEQWCSGSINIMTCFWLKGRRET